MEPAAHFPAPISAPELVRQELDPIDWVVPYLVPEGLTLLLGPPRIGKSELCLDLALGVGGDGGALGTLDVEPGEVLYLALEHTRRRLQERIQFLLADQPVPARLDIMTLDSAFPQLDQGGREQIESWIVAHPNARLVVVDPLGRVAPALQAKRRMQGTFAASLNQLRQFATERGIALLLVQRTRKHNAYDAAEAVYDAFGLSQAADNVLFLKRTSDARTVTLTATGPHADDEDYMLLWHHEELRWCLMGEADEVGLSRAREEILRVLQDEGRALTPREVYDILVAEADQMLYNPVASHDAVRQRMYQMRRAGLLNAFGGRYYPRVSIAARGGDGAVDADPATADDPDVADDPEAARSLAEARDRDLTP